MLQVGVVVKVLRVCLAILVVMAVVKGVEDRGMSTEGEDERKGSGRRRGID